MNSRNELVSKTNARLKALGCKLSIEIRGSKLYLRGVLPPSPQSEKSRSYRQRISLDLKATNPGIKMAERKAIEINERLTKGTFSWLGEEKFAVDRKLTVRNALAMAEKEYFKSRIKDRKSLYTWNSNYAVIWNQMGKDEIVTTELIRTFVISRVSASNRKKTINICKHICKAIGFDIDLEDLKVKVEGQKDSTRNAPTEEEIVFYYNHYLKWSRTNPQYVDLRGCHVWIYGMMATYGLRPHETRAVEWNSDGTINVLEHKTDKYYGPRYKVYPLPKEWVELFNLKSGTAQPLDVTIDDYRSLKYYSRKIQTSFQKAKIPFTPYMLRHAYAIRLMTHHVEVNVSASMMGHSPTTHMSIYRERFNEKIKSKMMQEAYESLRSAE